MAMQGSYIGNTTASQAVKAGSIPVPCSRKETPFVCWTKGVSFQRNKSLRICEIRFACEVLLRNVKCLRAWVDLFHFTFCVSRKFHIDRRSLFHVRRIFHFKCYVGDSMKSQTQSAGLWMRFHNRIPTAPHRRYC